MDRQKDEEVDDGSIIKNNQSTQKEGSSSCSPVVPPLSVAVRPKNEEKEEDKPSSSCDKTKISSVGGDSDVVGKKTKVSTTEKEEEPPKTCGVSTTTTGDRDDGNSKNIENKVEMSTSSDENPPTTMSGHDLSTLTRSQVDTTSKIGLTTEDTTGSSKTTGKNEDSGKNCNIDGREKVLDESLKDKNVNKSDISSSGANLKQQVKGEGISSDGEVANENLVVDGKINVCTISNNSKIDTDVKMTSIDAENVVNVKKGDEIIAETTKTDNKQHGPVAPEGDTQVGGCSNVPKEGEEKQADSFAVGGEIQNKPGKTTTSSFIVTNKDAEGTKKDDTQQIGEKTTCPEQPPKSFDYIHLSKDEGNLMSTITDDFQQVKITGDDGSLNQVASQKNPESSPVKPSASVSTSAAVNPSIPVQKTDSPKKSDENIKTNEPSLQQTSAPPPTESELDKLSSASAETMKPSTDSSLENTSDKPPSISSPQTNTSIMVSSSPLKQPSEKADDDSSRVTAVPTPLIQTVQSSTEDSSKGSLSRDLAGASQTVEHSNDTLLKDSAELTEVPKKSEQDAAVRTATLSLGDTVRDADELSSKRSGSDSQDVTPSDSLSIPSDRDLEGVDIASLGAADNDTGAASLKVTKDGASSSSSSSVLSIYHLKWIHFKSKKIPVITQNENGPCPLLAIMNVLLLQGRVTLESGLELITSEQLMDHLDECILENVPKTASEDVQLNYQQNMQDGMAVIHKLQTGLDVNVRFTGVQDFEYTTECIIFDLLGISLYHGWLVDPQAHEIVSAIGMCSYNQLVEKIIVQKSSEDFELFKEANIAENFLEKTASQLTYHGLCELSTTVKEGELCVFFRNNHFSTLYRHKNELFLLVTDQGFLNEFNVVWETLSSVEGDCYFVDAEFNTYTKPDPVSGNSVVTPPVVPIGSDQQIDQDYLVALSLDREQQLQREAWASHAGGGAGTGGGGGSGAGAAVPDPLKGQVPLSDLELAKKLQDEENQRAGAAAATGTSGRRNPRPAEACTSSGTRRTRDREKDKDSCLIL